jgi:hypothetical protein
MHTWGPELIHLLYPKSSLCASYLEFLLGYFQPRGSSAVFLHLAGHGGQ